MTHKRIGILTSGGDCPGLNAVIRAVVKCATQRGWDVFGISYGTVGFMDLAQGLSDPETFRLREHGYDIPGLLQGLDILQFLSGSILGSLSKGDPESDSGEILRGYERLQLDGLIGVGGDGSLRILSDLALRGHWNLVAIPKTIDNDIPLTERSVGFDTAVNTVTRSLYDLTFTAASHERVMVVQVMGRDAGHLALHGGIAGGADVILIPELIPALKEDIIDRVCRKIATLRRDGRHFALVVISEGIRNAAGLKVYSIAEDLAMSIRQHSQYLCTLDQHQFCGLDKVDTRVVVLGHLQRSGTPSSFDRLLASTFAKQAIDLIATDTYNQLVVWEEGQVKTRPLDQVVPLILQAHTENRCPNPVKPTDFILDTARAMGICLGDT